MKAILFTEQFWPQIGRIPSHIAGLAHALGAIGIDCTVIHAARDTTIWQSVPFGQAYDELKVIRVAASDHASIGQSIRDCVRDEATVIHAFTAFPTGVKSEVPRVFTNCHTEFLIDDAAERMDEWHRLFHGCAAIIATSDALHERTTALRGTPGKVWHIPLGVDTRHFSPNRQLRSEWRQRLWLDPSAVVILCPSNWRPSSGVLDFAHSLRHLEKAIDDQMAINVFLRKPDARSDVEYVDAVREALQESRFGQFASEVGELAYAEMPGLYNAGDICVLPSLRGVTGCSALEAMACGVAVIGTRSSGLIETLGRNQGALLVDHGNAPELATAIAETLNHPEMRLNMASAGRDAVRHQDFSSIAASVAAVYASVVGQSS